MLELLPAERPTESLIRLDPHIAQVARYIDGFFGFDQWFLFDTRWAAAHPDLARSLLRYASYWTHTRHRLSWHPGPSEEYGISGPVVSGHAGAARSRWFPGDLGLCVGRLTFRAGFEEGSEPCLDQV
ncbi:hypothetical protein ACFY2R_28810 [Micromonospora olivasterospora]|uniref:Uncharacterized protein n=1 Tax=Micromonospora olivasterospora TaxID=1880 RepID=A0A562IK96_MICOL|nr:hypothetical protein [Micromonospora olivasterospora]TWH71113.1 hypothetical protein JD77_06138 [Micromonospora olivasterospora]